MDETLVPFAGRIEASTPERLDRVADVLSSRASGARVTRSEAMRIALGRGLEVLERELGIVASADGGTVSAVKGDKRAAGKPPKK